jgi:hypothetical protein
VQFYAAQRVFCFKYPTALTRKNLMFLKSLTGILSVVVLSGCATLATQLTLDSSVDLLKKLVNLTYAQENQAILAQPSQRELLLTLKAEVDGIIRTVSEADELGSPAREQVLAGVLPQLNNSLEKNLNLAKAIAGELYSQSLAQTMVNNAEVYKKREFGSNLMRMYQQLAILKKKIWLGLAKPDNAQRMNQEYAFNIRFMQELCQMQSSTTASCLELPAAELPDES